MDIELIAAAVVSTLTPFMPFLLEAGKEGGKKLAEVIGEKGGETSWKKAQELWEKIKSHFGNDPKVKGAALMASAEPANEDLQKMFATVLAVRLKENPNVADELMNLLGGQNAVQQVLANRKSWVKDVLQQISGGGEQTIKADNNSQIQGVRQIKK
jgi:hypothetical protein